MINFFREKRGLSAGVDMCGFSEKAIRSYLVERNMRQMAV